MRKRSGKRPWTDDEVRLLIKLWTANLCTAAIAEKFGRSAGSVRSKARRLGLYRRSRCDLVKTIAATERRGRNNCIAGSRGWPTRSSPTHRPARPAVSPNTPISAVSVTAIVEAAAQISSEILWRRPVASVQRSPPCQAFGSLLPMLAPRRIPMRERAGRRKSSAGKATQAAAVTSDRLDGRAFRGGGAPVVRLSAPSRHCRRPRNERGAGAVASECAGFAAPRAQEPSLRLRRWGAPTTRPWRRSMVKRRCMLDRKVFWGDRNGPHTSPRAMKTKRYKALRSGLEEAHSTVSVE